MEQTPDTPYAPPGARVEDDPVPRRPILLWLASIWLGCRGLEYLRELVLYWGFNPSEWSIGAIIVYLLPSLICFMAGALLFNRNKLSIFFIAWCGIWQIFWIVATTGQTQFLVRLIWRLSQNWISLTLTFAVLLYSVWLWRRKGLD